MTPVLGTERKAVGSWASFTRGMVALALGFFHAGAPARLRASSGSIPGAVRAGIRRSALGDLARGVDVLADLRDELVERRELFLVADALHEVNAKPFSVQIAVEVEEMYFDAESGVHRRSVADVRDAAGERDRGRSVFQQVHDAGVD